MGEGSPSSLFKLIVVLTLASAGVYTVGMASPYWLSAEFRIPMPPPANLKVESHMGLFTNCKTIHYPKSANEDCGGDGARDWQYIAAGFAICGLFLGVVAFVDGVLVMCVRKFMGNKKIQIVQTVLNFLTAGCMTVSLILYSLNRRFVVDPRLPTFYVDFDFKWAFIVSAVAAFLFIGLFALNIIDLLLSSSSGVDVSNDDKESQEVNYTKTLNGGNVTVLGQRQRYS
ncbi:uncharacterized protein LOC101849697 [Aplysia californica]|uniref:Uncharacterized protein LOC101849697 n=1 Tax=Aplysia californica TaxID=6500 RepID=A0ABM1A0P6_APLCA|nr:uncharacterized protein LOC101849697 [Aplysia californica]